MSANHTVAQGEHLTAIAGRYGFRDYTIIWNHPKNADLKKNRPNPHLLFPGDVIYIPDKQAKMEKRPTTAVHTFRLSAPQLKVRIVVLDFDNQPIPNADCQLEIEGSLYALRTNAKGLIETTIQATAQNGTLRIPDLDIDVPVKIGHLDPEKEDSGWQARLRNAGYHIDPLASGEDGQRSLKYALEEFQCDHGLKVTGVADAATLDKLKAFHGC